MAEPIYKRIILKITGEAFLRNNIVLNQLAKQDLADEIETAFKLGVEMGIVLGGGNIARGRDLPDVDRDIADYMGMTATIINALFLQDALEKKNITVRTQSSIEMKPLAELYIPRRAIRHLEKGRIVILACGTGHPRCSTDYTAMLRAYELKADAMLKGTKVDGLFNEDPKLNRNAKLIPETTYQKAQKSNLKNILDNAALGLVRDNPEKIPLHIFNIFQKGNLEKLFLGKKIGSKITS